MDEGMREEEGRHRHRHKQMRRNRHRHRHRQMHQLTPYLLSRSGTSYQAKKLVRTRKFAEKFGQDKPVCVVVGAVAHGAVEPDWVDETIAVSGYAMSAAGVCCKLTDGFEEAWGIH